MKRHCLLFLALCAAIPACVACAMAPMSAVPDLVAGPVATSPVTDWSFVPRRKAPGRGQ
jgi:hypothetical protein